MHKQILDSKRQLEYVQLETTTGRNYTFKNSWQGFADGEVVILSAVICGSATSSNLLKADKYWFLYVFLN